MNQWLHQLYRRASSGELNLTRTWWARRILDWIHTGVVVVRQTGEDKLHVRAATLAYWSAVGFVPLLVLAFALTAPIGVKEAALDAVRDLLYESLLVSNENQVIQVVETLLDRVDLKTLGWLGVGGIMMIGSQIYYASELAYNDVFNTQIRRNWFFRFFMFNAVIVGVPVCIAGGMILSSRLAESLSFSGWWASLLLTTVALVSAIKVLPNTRVDWSAAITGGVISAALVEFSKYGFSTYMDLLGTKDNMTRLYGSVAFLPVFLLWLNVLWLVVLMGVELAFVVQNRRTLVEAQAERAGDPHAMWRRPDGLFAVGVTVALAQAEAASENGTADLYSVAGRCGVWSGHVRAALQVLEAAGLVRMTKERRYALVQPSDEIQASEVHRRWSEVGSPRLNEEDEIGGLVQQVRERLERDLDGTVAALAGLDSDAQDA
jgi:YihY family inner membrane protein